MSFSNFLGGSTTLITFTYPDQGTDGPFVNPEGEALYEIATITRANHPTQSTITKRGEGGPITEIRWEPKGKQPLVTLMGIDFGDHFFEEKKQFAMPTEYWFKDGREISFYWDEKELYNSTGKLVGTYSRQNTFLRRRAKLELEPACVVSLDYIVTSALLREIHRQQKDEKTAK